MLPKALRRISRAGGGYHPQFAGADEEPLAARVLGTYQGHVGEPRGDLRDALTDLEREAEDYKLVRGFAKLLEREATFEVRAPLPPRRARRAAFEAAEAVGVVSAAERERAIERAADALGADPDAVEASLHADREEREVLADLDARWSPSELVTRYNLALAQSALFDATEVRVRSSDPRRLVSATKRLGLLYEIERTDEGRELVLTGPTRLFRKTRRYGTRFARLVRSVAATEEWSLTATIDDRGSERTLELSDADPVRVPGSEDPAEAAGDEFDSGVEADFAARFRALDLDWSLVREPEPLETGTRAMIPDFAFDYDHADFRVFFEIMGFWTPEYVEKKLDQFANAEDVELIVAYDASLRADEGEEDLGAAIEARGGRAIPYDGTVRIKDVRDALRTYERDLVERAAASLPDDLRPEDDVVTIETLAGRHGVSEDAVEDAAFPEHERVGRTLVRPAVLEGLREEIEPGMSLSAAEDALDEVGIDDASAALSALGYRVEWEGLSGGTIREA